MSLEHTDPHRMRAGGVFTVVRKFPTHDAGAGHESVDDRVRCVPRLQPVNVSEVTESNLRASPTIPLAMNPNEQLVLRLHGHQPPLNEARDVTRPYEDPATQSG